MMPFVSYAQNFEDVMLWRCFNGLAKGFYIDVGANDPDVDSVTRSFSERGWRGINVEPASGCHAALCRRRPADINLMVALGAGPGTARLHVFDASGLSTLDEAHAGMHRAAGFDSHEEMVTVATLADICRAHAGEEIHFLKVDCEGSEADVLAGGDFAVFRPWVVLVEATCPNSREPSHAAWEPALLAAGYQFVWFDGLNRFYVADEHHANLARHFTVPPNVFDGFTRPSIVPRATPAPLPRDAFEASVPEALPLADRIAMAARCRDADDLPKVAGAGGVRTLADGTRVQTMHNGIKVPADGYCGAWMSELISLCGGLHEPQEERVFHEVVSRLPGNATMVELGGWWAYYSAWFLQGGAGRRAVVMEPDPAHRRVGEQTMALSGLAARFVSGFAARESLAPRPFKTESSGLQVLPGLTVGDLLDANGISFLDILHCDTQGAELDVLESCRPLFRAGRIGWVFLSTHAHQISGDPLTHQRCLSLLREEGLVIEVEHDVSESYSGDGLIVARGVDAPPGWKPVRISFNRASESLFRHPAFDLARLMRDAKGIGHADLVEAAYRVLLRREPEPEGFAHHVRVLDEGGSFEEFLTTVVRSDEFLAKLPGFPGDGPGQRGDEALAEGRYFKGGGPLSAQGWYFALDRDGALGSQGETLLVPRDRTILPVLFDQGSWGAREVEFLTERLRPEGRYTLCDIGANIGLFTRQMLVATPAIKSVVCVEPDANNFTALTFNLAAYAGRGVALHHIALGEEDGTATFHRDLENIGNRSLSPEAVRGRPSDTCTVRVAEAGRWVESQLVGEGPILWKSDTQGSDEMIVARMPKAVWDRVEIAMIELWRIDKPTTGRKEFLERIDRFPNKMLGLNRRVETADIATYLDAVDGKFEELLLWH